MMIGPRPEAVAEAESKITVAEGAVAFSKAHLEFHTIRSPIDGVLDSLTCHPGQTIAIGTPIGEVVDTRQVLVSRLPSRSIGAADPRRAKGPVKTVESRPGAPQASRDGRRGTGRGRSSSSAGSPTPRPETSRSWFWSITLTGRLTLGQTMGVTITVDEHSGVLEVPPPRSSTWARGPS